MTKNKVKKKFNAKLFFSILGIFVLVNIFLLVVQNISMLVLRHYVESFESVEYDNQVIPEYDDELGHYVFTKDDEFKVMDITDIHIGGGFWSLEKDKKTIYEVMSMIQQEKPDLVVLDGDNTFCVPGPIFSGGGTFNNKMTARCVDLMFETLGVYYTTVFGNHDTESFCYYNREQIGDYYSNSDSGYCIFRSEFTDKGIYDRYSVSNQCVVIKNSNGDIAKLLMLIDTNDYIDDSLSATINWYYDTIHEEQVDWAVDTIKELSDNYNYGIPLKSIFFMHIPLGEYELAYQDFLAGGDTKLVGGWFDEVVTEVTRTDGSKIDARIWYGGITNTDSIEDKDHLFERLTQNGTYNGKECINSMSAVFCGHDHANNGTLYYKGVLLSYGNSMDNLAYDDFGGIWKYGKQRGCVVIKIQTSGLLKGVFTETHKNCFNDYDIDPNKFTECDVTKLYYSEGAIGKDYDYSIFDVYY